MCNTNIWLSGQRNPFDNAKQHVESKAQKTKMHGSSMISSKDISSYFQAPLQKEPISDKKPSFKPRLSCHYDMGSITKTTL